MQDLTNEARKRKKLIRNLKHLVERPETSHTLEIRLIIPPNNTEKLLLKSFKYLSTRNLTLKRKTGWRGDSAARFWFPAQTRWFFF